MKSKQGALSKFLGVSFNEVEESSYDENTFQVGTQDYLVLTDDEADSAVCENILDSVWAFRPEFLVSHMPAGVTEDVIEAVQEKCEGGNAALLAMIQDVAHFLDDAVACDGRGHFLSGYDGEEHEVCGYYIYRVN